MHLAEGVAHVLDLPGRLLGVADTNDSGLTTAATQIGGCGVWVGRGSTVTSRKR